MVRNIQDAIDEYRVPIEQPGATKSETFTLLPDVFPSKDIYEWYTKNTSTSTHKSKRVNTKPISDESKFSRFIFDVCMKDLLFSEIFNLLNNEGNTARVQPNIKDNELANDILKKSGLVRSQNTVVNHKYMFNIMDRQTIDVKPAIDSYRQIDSFGLKKLTTSQFLLRANMVNVLSCHSFDANNRPGGNAGYIYSPFWFSVGVYGRKVRPNLLDKSFRTADPALHDQITRVVSEIPQLLISANICVGYVPYNKNCICPCFYISRVYGDRYNLAFWKIVDYLAHKYPKFSIAIRSDNARDGLPESLPFNKNWNETIEEMFFTPPFYPSITIDFRGKAYLPSRHSDIAKPLELKSGKVFESLCCRVIHTGSGVYQKATFDLEYLLQGSQTKMVTYSNVINDICDFCDNAAIDFLPGTTQQYYYNNGNLIPLSGVCRACAGNLRFLSDDNFYYNIREDGYSAVYLEDIGWETSSFYCNLSPTYINAVSGKIHWNRKGFIKHFRSLPPESPTTKRIIKEYVKRNTRVVTKKTVFADVMEADTPYRAVTISWGIEQEEDGA